MPFGLQVIGRFRGDLDVFNAAEAMEYGFRANPILRRLQPDLKNLAIARPELKSIVTHPPSRARD